jgi:putative ABC transport system permease protein
MIPILIFMYLKIRLIRNLLVSFIRMVCQLALVAVYLEYIFKLNYIWVNILWVALMIVVANQAILKQSSLRFKVFFLRTLPIYFFSILLNFATFLILFDVATFFSARYLIPIGGMVLGNILRGNIISLDRFFSALKKRQDEYIYYVSLGASTPEALLPFIGESIKASISPYLATVATMGLVSLPGMMTGQILGGASPVVAIQYQVMIMIAIFVTSSVSSLLVVVFASRIAMDRYGRLKENLFITS